MLPVALLTVAIRLLALPQVAAHVGGRAEVEVFACPHLGGDGHLGQQQQAQQQVSADVTTGLHETKPMPSLHAAQHLVRTLLTGRRSPVTARVRLCPGTHTLSQPLRFTDEDNPGGLHDVLWTSYGSPATISGGRNLTMWAPIPKAPAGLWQAVAPPGQYARQLWVDKKRQARPSAVGVNGSCGADEDFTGCSVLSLPDGTVVSLTQQWENATGCPADRPHAPCIPIGYVLNSTLPLHWANPTEVEFTFTRCGTEWTEARCTIANITAHGSSSSLITMTTPCFGQVARARFGKTIPLMPRRIENVFNRHDTWANTLKPGQFYFDRELKTVYSATVSGAAPGTAAVIGTSDTLIEGAANVSGITFSGIHFELAGGWQGVNSKHGLPQYQAGYRPIARLPNDYPIPGSCPIWGAPAGNCWSNLRPIPAAISFASGQRIRFESCSFRRFGSAAVWFGTGSRNCSVESSTFDDISGSAVMIGGIEDAGQADSALWTAGNVLRNSTITNVALEYHGSAGVLIGWSADTLISHNEIANMSYTGISNGWVGHSLPSLVLSSHWQLAALS